MSYGVPRRVVAGLLAIAVVAALVAVTLDGPGRVLFAVLGLGAAAEAARSLVLRPTLAADADGVTVAHGVRRERFAWPEVTNVTTLDPPGSGRRLRRRANALEIDLGDRLVVVAGYRLDAPVNDVAAALGLIRSR